MKLLPTSELSMILRLNQKTCGTEVRLIEEVLTAIIGVVSILTTTLVVLALHPV